MDVIREEINLAFEGPLADIDGLPTGLLYGIILAVAHSAGRAALPAIKEALRPFFGEPEQEHQGWLRGLLQYGGNMPARVNIGRTSARVTLGRRLKADRVQELSEALAQVPGASHLRIQAHRRIFAEPGSRDSQTIE